MATRKRRRRGREERREVVREVREEEGVRPAIEELMGESEHSLRVAGHEERGSTRKKVTGVVEEEIDIQPDDMGRDALERATEITETHDEHIEPLRGPLR